MPTRPEDFTKIKEYQNKASDLSTQAAGYVAGSNVLGDKVMEAVRADRTQRGVSKLSTDVGNVMGQMVTDPTTLREGPQSLSAQGLVDPFSVNELTSNARAQNLKTLGTVANQEAQNQGSIDEVIQAGANQLKARAQTLLAQAEEATSQANILQQEWERSLAERKLAAGSGGEKTVKSNIPTLMPNYTPTAGYGTVSDDGKWVYTGKGAFGWEEVTGGEPKPTKPAADGTISPGGTYIYYKGSWYSEDELAMLSKTSSITKNQGDGELKF